MKTLHGTGNLQVARQQHEIFDHFVWYVTAHQWTSLAADANAAVAATNMAGGVLSISTGDADDNNEAAVRSTAEVYKFGADAPLFAEGVVKFTDLAGNAANVAFGLADAFGADLITDDGAGITANSAVLIYKRDGETTWRAYCENNGTVHDTPSETAAGGTWQTLAIEVLAVDGTFVEVMYYVDGEPLRETASGWRRPIKHRLAYASATEMHLGVYGKAGAAATLTVLVDRLSAAQRRTN